MFLVGLTGGIASGKSSVASLWESLGAEVIDADQLAREVVQPGSTGLAEIEEAFGTAVITESGELDRTKLAQLVFQSSELRKKLENITHSRIKKLAEQRLANSKAEITVYVIPLLVESQSELPFDFIVTVEAPEYEQISRMTTTRNMTQQEAISRIRSQATPAQRANVSDRILNSNQSFELLMKDSRALWSELVSLATKKRAQHG